MLVFVVDSVGSQRGMHYYNFPLISAANEMGANTVLISIDEMSNHPLRPHNLTIRSGFKGIYGNYPRWLRGVKYGLALLRIAWWITLEKPQLVHFHFFQVPQLDYLLIRGIRWLGITTVITVHDVLPFEVGTEVATARNSIYHKLYSVASGLILHSEYALAMLRELDPELVEKAIVIAHAGFTEVSNNLRQAYSISSKEAKSRLGLMPTTPLILVFGTIKVNKRLDLTLHAMTILLKSIPEARLAVVGKPQDRDVTPDVELAVQLGISENVHWHLDRLSDEELTCFLEAADVVVFPYQWVYQSGAILLAMSFSKPIVATAARGNADLIKDNETGILVALDEPAAMAQAISQIISNKSQAMVLGQAAYAYAKDQLSTQNIARLTLAFYEQVCANGKKH